MSAPCRHRYVRRYDDGDGRWDILCLECGAWPEEEDLDPFAASAWQVEEGQDWTEVYEENKREGWRQN